MIYVLSLKDPIPDGCKIVNTTSHATDEYQALSPFKLGPCNLYDGYISKNVENGWQYSKVYPGFVDENNVPTDSYWEWAQRGWNDSWAHRYPMGKGAKPLFSWWRDEPLGYIQARKSIYVPLYARAVVQTHAFQELKALHECGQDVALLDFDGYNYIDMRYSLSDVLNNAHKTMGHAFIVAMLLLEDPALEECEI